MKGKREVVFGGCLFTVFKGRKRLPDGRNAYFEEIDHPGAALIIPFVKEKIIFIRQYRGVIEKYIWELPAGIIDPGETPYSCAKRELVEETGYEAEKIKKIGLIYTTPGFCNEKIHIFRADCKRDGTGKRDPDELIRVKQMTKDGVRRLFKNGRISDSKTIAALSFAGIL
ncbi:MAG: NUDIX hydrolase [Candidatus Omnitrophota bacterium]|nr:NUDIX hydrolase [Candidatus Omnitrophota bacterium]